MRCIYIPALNLGIFVPLFIIGAILVAIMARYSVVLALTSGGEVLYTLGPDKSVPPGESICHIAPLCVVGMSSIWYTL